MNDDDDDVDQVSVSAHFKCCCFVLQRVLFVIIFVIADVSAAVIKINTGIYQDLCLTKASGMWK